MTRLIRGSDTYGRVKTVDNTPIVTKFAMLQAFPLFPVQSYYFVSQSTSPYWKRLLLGRQDVVVQGIPLAALDAASVAMAYVRGICSVVVLAGSVAFFAVVVMQLAGGHVDDVAKNATMVLSVALVGAAIVGLASYRISFTSMRERDIRHYCGELLEMAIDPALIPAELAEQLCLGLPATLAQPVSKRTKVIYELIQVRAALTRTLDTLQLEHRTDELIETVSRLPQPSVSPIARW